MNDPTKIKYRVVKAREGIEDLNMNEQNVHLAFRPSGKDFVRIIEKCPRVRKIQLPGSYYKTISGFTIAMLKLQKIELLKGDVWGHRSDINIYAEVNQEKKESEEFN